MIKDNLSLKDLKIISQNFLTEIEKSCAGEKTSLDFIVHEISPSLLVGINENFQALVIGGSVFKKALLRKTEKGIEIIKIENEKNIHFCNENDFLDLILNEIYPNINVLTLNFAYPLKPVFENGKPDGILLRGTKENKLDDLIGKQIGKEIEDYVFIKINKKIKVAVANDTICLLTSGLTKFQKEKLAGGVVGTGINAAFFIDKNKMINLESRSFDKFTQTETGKTVDDESSQPGADLFEKEIAGAYLFKHFNLLLKENNINYPPLPSTEELNKISRTDIPQVSQIAQNLLKRSAQLVACQIAGIVEFKKRDMNFVMEGSLFWKGNNYKETVVKTVKKLSPKYKVNFVEIENSAILGAAKLID